MEIVHFMISQFPVLSKVAVIQSYAFLHFNLPIHVLTRKISNKIHQPFICGRDRTDLCRQSSLGRKSLTGSLSVYLGPPIMNDRKISAPSCLVCGLCQC